MQLAKLIASCFDLRNILLSNQNNVTWLLYHNLNMFMIIVTILVLVCVYVFMIMQKLVVIAMKMPSRLGSYEQDNQ